MGRQFRSVRRGGGPLPSGARPFVGPVTVTSSSVNIVIPNYGVTDVSTWAAGDYVLDVPEVGVEKTILSYGASTLAWVIFTSTAHPSGISIGGASNTRITFKTSDSCCISLIGVNSTGWAIQGVYPPSLAANTTAVVIGTS